MVSAAPRLAVIVPVYNERENIAPFFERVARTLEALSGLARWSVVFVNDGSRDSSLDEILSLRSRDGRVKVISLSRNFGYHAVLVAALSLVDSDLYAVLDVDGEDPPELLAQFYRAISEGNDVAYGIRANREEPGIVTLGRRLFYKTLRRIGDAEVVEWMAEFAMVTRQVRDAVLLPRTTYPFIRAEIGFVGFNRVGIPYRRGKRTHGRSHYSVIGLTRFAVAGLLASSTFPLRFVLYAAIVIALAYPIVIWTLGIGPLGAATLAAIIALYFLLISASLISLYVARTYKNVVARPVYIVDRNRTFLDDA